MLLNSLRKYFITSIIIAVLFSLFSFFEKINFNILANPDINIGLIIEIEHMFGLIFLNLLPILLINHFVLSKIKYAFYFIIAIVFLSYLFFTSSQSPYTNIEVLSRAIIQSSVISIILIINYLLFEKYKIKSLLYIFTILVFIFSVYASYDIGIKEKNIYNHNESEKEVNIYIGGVLEGIDNYSILYSMLYGKNSLNKIQKYYNKSLQLDIDLISKHPIFLKRLIDNGYCEEWKKLRDEHSGVFINTSIIDNECNYKK